MAFPVSGFSPACCTVDQLVTALIDPKGGMRRFKDLFSKNMNLINAPDSHGKPLIFYVCNDTQLKKLKFLIQKGADCNSRNERMETPLHLATWSGQYQCMKLLLEKGADKSLANLSGNRPWEYAQLKDDDQAGEILQKGG